MTPISSELLLNLLILIKFMSTLLLLFSLTLSTNFNFSYNNHILNCSTAGKDVKYGDHVLYVTIEIININLIYFVVQHY